MFNKTACIKKYVFFIIGCWFVFISCNQISNKNNVEDINKTITTDTILADQISDDLEDEDYKEFYEKYFRNFSYDGIKVFQNIGYTESDHTRDIFQVMDTIVGLFKKGNAYHLRTCMIEKTNVYENPCGFTQIEATLNTEENPLFLFRGLKHYNKSEAIDTIPANLKIWTGQKKDFVFNNISYQLRAEGTVLEKGNEGTEMYYENIKNYKLYLTSGGKSQCIVEMKKFSDTMTELCWIGDLDGDGKPDFIVSSPDWYEDYRVLLLLSSYAEGNDLVKLVSITVDSFAC